MIWTGGTGAGDWLAHQIGLGARTLITGAIFIGMMIYFYAIEHGNELQNGSPLGATS
jgi:uncharacterized membrane-anchored protein